MPTTVTRRTPSKGSTAVGVIDAPRRRGRPARLSRAAILEQALRLVDDEGAEALTMRRLGSELGVEAMSLYRHVENKRALIDGIAERLMAEVDSHIRQGGGWVEAARSMSIGIRRVARAHPAAFELVGMRAMNTHNALRPIEALLADLRAGGFAPGRAVAAYRLISSYSRGFALAEITGFTLATNPRDPARLTSEQLPADEFPTIHELARPLSHQPTNAHFLAGLETIIDGLRRELEATAR
jgi:AcrR family transcriptional regulator